MAGICQQLGLRALLCAAPVGRGQGICWAAYPARDADQIAFCEQRDSTLTNSALNEKAPAAEGWKTIPSWYVVGDADKVIPPPLQIMMA
jgi:hypothetical protein